MFSTFVYSDISPESVRGPRRLGRAPNATSESSPSALGSTGGVGRASGGMGCQHLHDHGDLRRLEEPAEAPEASRQES